MALVGVWCAQGNIGAQCNSGVSVSFSDFTDGYWESADSLKLHYRDYAGREDRPPILCLPGLTRNARDFEPVAEAFAGEWRVICAEFRGRGDSEYAKDSATYLPPQYAADVLALYEHLGIDKAVIIGTSLGGLVTMLIALQYPEKLAAVVLNDIGPVIEAEGLERIKDYVGQGRSFPTWMHAARELQESSGHIYPDFGIADFLRLAKRSMCLSTNGRIQLDYDMKIAEPFAAAAGAEDAPVFDMWPAFRALGGRPLLALRGELSDLFSADTLAKMQAELPEMEALTVPRVGHVPTLEEPMVREAIARLLAKVA